MTELFFWNKRICLLGLTAILVNVCMTPTSSTGVATPEADSVVNVPD